MSPGQRAGEAFLASDLIPEYAIGFYHGWMYANGFDGTVLSERYAFQDWLTEYRKN